MSRPKLWWVLVPALLVISLGVVFGPHRGTAEPALSGTVLGDHAAPNFRLTDQFGHPTSPVQFRGRPVLITFMQAHCKELCPIVAEKIRRSIHQLGPSGRDIAILAVSVDPENDTAAAVRQFSRTHGMLHRWHYLTGTRSQLSRIWRAYGIYGPPRDASQALRDIHTSATYLVDQRGRERVLFASSLDSLALERDLRVILGLPLGGLNSVADPAPEVGHPAPDFVLPAVAGTNLALSSLHGKVVLLNFWATWCTACRTEMPELQRTYQRLRGRGFAVLGVDKQEPLGDVNVFLRELHVTYPNVRDANGSVTTRYEVAGLPTTFVIDRQGVIRSVRLGVIDHQFISQSVEPLLATKG